MKKLIIAILLLLTGVLQAQVVNAPIRGNSKLTDSIVVGKGELTVKSDSVFRVLAYAYFPYMFYSSGNNSFTGNSTFSGLNTFSGYKTTFKSLRLTSGGNDTISVTDDYSLIIKTSDTTRLTISNRGDITFPSAVLDKGTWYRNGFRFLSSTRPSWVPVGGGDTGSAVISYNLFFGENSGSLTPRFTSYGGKSYEGNYNSAFGKNSLTSLTSGFYNCGFGYNTGNAITTGSLNFPLGAFSGGSITTGVQNVALGGESMVYGNGSYNVWIGARTGYGVSSNNNSLNVGIGTRSGFTITTGSYNTLVGTNSGEGLTTGTNNIFIGKYGDNNAIKLWGRTTTGSRNIVISDTGKVFNTNGSIGLSNDSTANGHLNIGRTYYARDIYTDSVKTGIGIRDDSVTARLHIKAGSTQRHTAPLKFNSGSLLTTTEAGAVEFLTDDLYYTQTTNTSRNRIAIDRSDTLSTYASSVSVTMQGSLKQVTVTGDCTLNATGGVAGSTMVLYFNCTAIADKIITFGTNFKSKGTVTLVVATAATNEATVTFVCLDGTNWIETARSVGM